MILFQKGLVFLIIIPWVLCMSATYEAFNISCLNSSYIINHTSPIQLAIPPYSLVNLQADLRHLNSAADLQGVILTIKINNIDTGGEYTETIGLNITTNAYSLYAASHIILSAEYTITQTTIDMAQTRSYLLMNSVSALVTPPAPLGQEQKSFLFVITQNDFISLPYNVIEASNLESFTGYFLSKDSQLSAMKSRQTSTPSYNDYWSAYQQITMPYLPYFSNCENNGDYLYLSQLIHNSSECQLYGYNSTPINQFKFGSSAIADTCTITRKCIFDQIPGSYEYPVWGSIDSTTKYLFSVTASEYADPYAPLREDEFKQTQLVKCVIKGSKGDNTTSMLPLKTKITLGYHQQTSQSRVLLNCQVEFSLYTTSSSNFQYELQINFVPLNHTQILLDFGFRWYIYMLVFIIIGFISNLQFIIFWLYHVITTLKNKIHFRLCIYLTMIKEILKGVLLAVVIVIFLTFAVELIMNGTFFAIKLSPTFSSLWDYLVVDNIGVLAETNLGTIRIARLGYVYIFISVYLAYHLSPLIVGKQRKSKDYQDYEILGQKFKPFQWNRGKFLFGMYIIALCSAGYLYFTYSSFFNDNIWFIIVMMQIAQMVLEQILNSLYQDVLPTIPMKLSVGVLAYLATMGAIDLYYFMLGYLVDVGISTIERVYLSLIQQKITKFVEEKNEQLHRFYINLLNDEQEQHQKKSQDNKSIDKDNQKIIIENYVNEVQLLSEKVEEDYQFVDLTDFPVYKADQALKNLLIKSLTDKNQQFIKNNTKFQKETFIKLELNQDQKKEIENKKFQLLTDSAANMVQYLLQPAIVFMLWLTYNSSSILPNFAIAYQNCILYLLSSIILAIYYQFNIIIIIHVLELYFNFDYKRLIEDLLGRFAQKKSFWITDCEHWQQPIDYLQTKSKACGRYCLSSQMFFVVSLYTCLIYLFIIGFTAIISSQHNIFKDPFLVPIILFWLLLLQLFEWLLKKVVYFFDIWDYASFASGGNRITEEPLEPRSADQQTQHMLVQSMGTSQIRFTFKQLAQESLPVSDNSKKDIKDILEAKLKTICRKLQPKFARQDFRLQYSKKNKDFIKKNIQQILPLVNSFPESDNHWLGKNESLQGKNSKKKEAKTIDPGVSDFVSSWLKRVESNRAKRKDEGIERERKLKRCNFCFRTWAIYYGYEGICLQCSKHLFSQRQAKQE